MSGASTPHARESPTMPNRNRCRVFQAISGSSDPTYSEQGNQPARTRAVDHGIEKYCELEGVPYQTHIKEPVSE
jgi:hypothetical protein